MHMFGVVWVWLCSRVSDIYQEYGLVNVRVYEGN